jgi:hypothetical protein
MASDLYLDYIEKLSKGIAFTFTVSVDVVIIFVALLVVTSNSFEGLPSVIISVVAVAALASSWVTHMVISKYIALWLQRKFPGRNDK